MGTPLVVEEIQLKGTSQWGPKYFSQRYGAHRVTTINCETGEIREIPLAEFMAIMGRPAVDGEIWKLKVRQVAAISTDWTDENFTRTGHRVIILETYSPTLIRHSKMVFRLGTIHAETGCLILHPFPLPMGFFRI